MDRSFIKQEIRALMDVIQEQQATILSYTEKAPQLEMDILMGNIRKVYELFTELNKSAGTEKMTPPAPRYEQETKHPDELIAKAELFEKEATEPEPEPLSVSIPVEIAELKNEQANAPVHMQQDLIVADVEVPVAPVPDEVITEAVIPQVAIVKERAKEFSRPSTKVAATASLFDETPTIADKFQGTQTVREKIANSKDDKSIAERLQQHPVSDLKKSIGINEKFAFINELFDGDLDEYSKAIDQLNGCKSYQDALSVLNDTLSSKYNWSPSGESFVQLKNLVERRFTS